MPNHCCEHMDHATQLKCDTHRDEFECPDVLIIYVDRFAEYGIIFHDGGTAYSIISYCPYCGTKLPSSKRDIWFDELRKLGIDDPDEQDIPREFESGLWYKNKGL